MSDLASTVLLLSGVSEPEYKERLAEMAAQARDLKAAQKDMEAERAANQAVLQQIQAERRQIEAIREEMGQREGKLQSDTGTLADTIASFNKEKTAFEMIRQRVDSDHQQREMALQSSEGLARIHHQKLDEREAAVKAREDAVAQAEMVHQKRRMAAQAFLDVE